MQNVEDMKAMLSTRMQVEALRTYLFSYSTYYDAIAMDQLEAMFELPRQTIHSTVSKMMINEEVRRGGCVCVCMWLCV